MFGFEEFHGCGLFRGVEVLDIKSTRELCKSHGQHPCGIKGALDESDMFGLKETGNALSFKP